MIYITEEKKKELEAKIAELEFIAANDLLQNTERDLAQSSLNIYKEILSSAIVLPVEESYEEDGVVLIEKRWMFKKYPKGVIIKP
jgi:hypothetical protein